MRVLVVEDEIRMAVLLKRALEEESHAVDVAADGPEGLWMATKNAYGAIVLDVMLPGFDGIQSCRRLREAGIWVPVLMLTARDSVGDRVRGLDAGADDYLVKPFSLLELLRLHHEPGRTGAGRSRGFLRRHRLRRGLAIVQAIAVAHGGVAFARNKPGGGAVVGLRLPQAAGDAAFLPLEDNPAGE